MSSGAGRADPTPPDPIPTGPSAPSRPADAGAPAFPAPSRESVILAATSGTGGFGGFPFPLGATVTDGGTNFSVHADSNQVDLCLLDTAGAQEFRVPMEERHYGVWHAFVPGVQAGQRYGYRALDRDPGKLLLDPYARRIDTPFYDLIAASEPNVDTLGRAPLGVVTDRLDPPATGPAVPWPDTVIYEAHVRGLTELHPSVPAELRGTYLGAAHPAVIEHLQSLNVTAVELLPVHAHTSEPGLVATGRTNYWGYATLSYFAPHPGYASRPGQEIAEFAALVDAYHRAGLEVLLDVVYNHTCEGGIDLPVELSWRGLAPDTYYLPQGHDITGTGNTLDPAGLPVIRMVTDSLRYWAGEFGVDGFRFDLASTLGRPHGGAFDPASAMLTAIAADPLLATRKLIAEPWDATGEGYAVGRFGGQWAEWNDHYRDTVRDFWRGVGGLRDLGYRLSGSRDLYDARGPWASVNFVTAHDGFTLRDLVSYDEQHNEGNGEGNRDGTRNNRSANYGVEGDTSDPVVLALRSRQVRNFLATLALSTGTPLLTMGDEMGRTQQGNNNAYCQDNAISWVDWASLPGPADREFAPDLLVFAQRALAIRREAPALRQDEFFEGRPVEGGNGLADLVWFNPDGTQMTGADWFDGERRTAVLWFSGYRVHGRGPGGRPLSDESWLLVLHAGADPITITLPGPPYANGYLPELDTDRPTGVPDNTDPLPAGQPLPLPGRTMWVMRVEPVQT